MHLHTLEHIKDLLENEMKIEDRKPKIEIRDMTGTGDHLEIQITSPKFLNKSILQQHRLVMDILKNKFNQGLHAIKLKTIPTKD